MANSACRSKKQLKKIYKKRIYCCVLTVILFIGLLQFLCGSLYNMTRYIVLYKQINMLEKLNTEAAKKNNQLKNQLKVYSSYYGIEELARNNLKMVGEDEVLVLIKN